MVVILTKEESHNNSNISEYKMRFFFRQTRAYKCEQAKQWQKHDYLCYLNDIDINIVKKQSERVAFFVFII